MAKAPRTALIGVGPVSQSWVAKLPGLRQNLGPVRSSSLRIASRLVNSIKAGTPTDSFDAISKAELLLIAVPDAHFDQWLEQLLNCGADWSGTSIVVCSRKLDSASLEPLRAKGASTASLDEMEAFENNRYLFEGQKLALHRLRRLVEGDGTGRIIGIHERMRPVYEAGLTFASGMIFPMIASAVDSLRAAGLHSKAAEGVIELAVTNALRSYLRAGKRGWSGPIADADRVELRRQYNGLFDVDPTLAEMYLKIALDFLVEMAPNAKRSAKGDSAKGDLLKIELNH